MQSRKTYTLVLIKIKQRFHGGIGSLAVWSLWEGEGSFLLHLIHIKCANFTGINTHVTADGSCNLMQFLSV